MRELLQRHKKILSICLTVICSVFVVAFVVSAATTIGANVTTTGTLNITGLSTLGRTSSSMISSYGALYIGTTATTTISGTSASFASSITPVSAGKDVGAYGTPWRNVYASGTIMAFGGTNATTTINLGSTGGSAAKGSCLIMTGENGTLYYITVAPLATSTGLRVSTDSCL